MVYPIKHRGINPILTLCFNVYSPIVYICLFTYELAWKSLANIFKCVAIHRLIN